MIYWLVNWLGSDYFTRSGLGLRIAAAGVLSFVLVCTAGAGLATAALAGLAAAGLPVVLAKPASVAVSMVWNYALMRRVVFAAEGER